MNRLTTQASAALVTAFVVVGCGPGTTGNGTAPDFNSMAAQAARTTTCQSSTPLIRQVGSGLGRPSAASSIALDTISRALQKLSNASQDSLLQQRLQNFVDEIEVLRAAWSHHSTRTVDVTDQLRGMVNGFGRTCPGH